MTLHEFIEDYKQKHALSNALLYEQTGVSQHALYNLRFKRPANKTYRKLAAGLNIDVTELTCLPILKEETN